MGATLYAILYEKFPFNDRSGAKARCTIDLSYSLHGKTMDTTFEEYFSLKCANHMLKSQGWYTVHNVIGLMIHQDPAMRPTAEHALHLF
jgi:hypothetical protein